jgi:trimeric autotransporter adhesin
VTPGGLLYVGGKVYAGGVFTNAGASGADNLAVWDGTSWKPFCTVPGETIGNVRALQVVGPTLYVGGDFQDGAGIDTADYLLACDLASGMPDDTTVDPLHPFSGPVKALTATSDGRLYAGGRFGDLENIPAADNVAYLPQGGTWHPMGSGGGVCDCALDAYVRGLTANGTDVYVGTEGSNVAGIAQADHVVKWDGSAWSAMGSNTGGADGWFPAATSIYDLASVGTHVFATGTFQNADGDGRADNIAFFRRQHLALGRVQRRRLRPVGRRGLRPRDRRPAAVRGRKLHQRWR